MVKKDECEKALNDLAELWDCKVDDPPEKIKLFDKNFSIWLEYQEGENLPHPESKSRNSNMS